MGVVKNIEWARDGSGGHVQGSVVQFIMELVEFQPGKRLPPCAVIVDLLGRGYIGGGMGGGLSWSASIVSVTPSIYDEAKAILPVSQRVDGCDSVTYEEWIAWCSERDYGVDYALHLGLLNAMRQAWLARESSQSALAIENYENAVSEYLSFVNSKFGAQAKPSTR